MMRILNIGHGYRRIRHSEQNVQNIRYWSQHLELHRSSDTDPALTMYSTAPALTFFCSRLYTVVLYMHYAGLGRKTASESPLNQNQQIKNRC
jgi:hypothetical protein